MSVSVEAGLAVRSSTAPVRIDSGPVKHTAQVEKGQSMEIH